MYSYDDLEGILLEQVKEAAREEPESDRATLARERYELFVTAGIIPDEFGETVGGSFVW